MDHFLYRDGALFAEDVPVSEIAAAVGTPFYCYSAATLLRHYRLFDEALEGMDHLVCFAMKSNSNQAILTLLARAGAGMDVVSGGEYARARPSDRALLVLTMLLTVFIDLTVAIGVGVAIGLALRLSRRESVQTDWTPPDR